MRAPGWRHSMERNIASKQVHVVKVGST